MQRTNATKIHNQPQEKGGGITNRGDATTHTITLHRLTDLEIPCLHGDNVVISAPAIYALDKKILPCLGVHRDVNGLEYVVLGGDEYNYSLVEEGTIELYTVV